MSRAENSKAVAAVYDRRRTPRSAASALIERRYKKLLAAARVAQRNAYAPYSKFCVGAALLSARGKLFTGVNVENASYGLTICAERVAITKAVSEGHRTFRAMAVVAPYARLTPCGACRQVLAEFGDCVVLCADSRNTKRVRIFLLSELLPHAFKL